MDIWSADSEGMLLFEVGIDNHNPIFSFIWLACSSRECAQDPPKYLQTVVCGVPCFKILPWTFVSEFGHYKDGTRALLDLQESEPCLLVAS